MILYHGTNRLFDKFDLAKSFLGKDFGRGVYLTTSYEQAKEWAQKKARKTGKPYVYTYDIPDKFLTDSKHYKILQFLTYNKEWADYLVACRIDLEETSHDIVYDRMADNTYEELTDVLYGYHLGNVSLTVLLMTVRQRNKEYDQYCFKTRRVVDIVNVCRVSSEEV